VAIRAVQSHDPRAEQRPGQSYDVVAEVPRPTLEQIRASQARIAENRVDVYAVPEGHPP
jgi:hypothetical protein